MQSEDDRFMVRYVCLGRFFTFWQQVQKIQNRKSARSGSLVGKNFRYYSEVQDGKSAVEDKPSVRDGDHAKNSSPFRINELNVLRCTRNANRLTNHAKAIVNKT